MSQNKKIFQQKKNEKERKGKTKINWPYAMPTSAWTLICEEKNIQTVSNPISFYIPLKISHDYYGSGLIWVP